MPPGSMQQENPKRIAALLVEALPLGQRGFGCLLQGTPPGHGSSQCLARSCEHSAEELRERENGQSEGKKGGGATEEIENA
ncbi:hypothetical protein HPB48_020770 [Haemaphysalis longicornis]|uniref:Uncharacterized protein n=1 Tax=Haemaphysalis longicornis TaxID=44386 RepID=A0A9J6GNU4_HAELO|nr:hypothetical protein HPB48_020770 [Haemaphysalis longicornis]